jgi:cobalt-zinc-cadmium efflux system outer membrane protein
MRLTARSAVFAVTLVLAWLQRVACAAEPLTLEAALDLAERNNPRLRSAILEVERARSGIRTARAFPNPQVLVLTGPVSARVPGVTSGRGTNWEIGQPIDLPSQRAPRIRAAEAGLDGSRFALDEARLQLRADVRQAFYTVLRRRAEYELALDNQRLLEETRQRIALSVSVGERPKFELVRIDAELASAVNLSASARLRVAQAVTQLKLLVGIEAGADVEVTGAAPPEAAPAPLESLRTTMFERYPGLAQARTEVERTQQRLAAERALRVPRPTLFAGQQIDPEMSFTTFGLSLPVPIFDQRTGPIGEAAAQFQQATSFADQRRLELNAALEAAYSRLLVAQQQIAAFEGGLLRQAENALKVAEAAFRFGERAFLEVLDAQRVLRAVRADFLAARFERVAAQVEIDRLTAADLSGDTR